MDRQILVFGQGLEPGSLPRMPEAMTFAKAFDVLKSLGCLAQPSSRVVTKLFIAWLAPR